MTDHENRETLRQAMKDWDAATPEQRAAATTAASQAAEATSDFWKDAEIISQYTRAEAIEDGFIVDANVGDLDEVSRQHFPNARASMTSALYELVEKAVAHPRWLNDLRGVWHDICFMSRFRNADGLFKVIITGTGRVRNHVLKRVEGVDDDGRTPTVTFMLRGED